MIIENESTINNNNTINNSNSNSFYNQQQSSPASPRSPLFHHHIYNIQQQQQQQQQQNTNNTTSSSTSSPSTTTSLSPLNRSPYTQSPVLQSPTSNLTQQQQQQSSQSQSQVSHKKSNSNSNIQQQQQQQQSSNKPPNQVHHKLKQRTLFEKLYTESGFNCAKSWYERNTANTDFILGESQFLMLMHHLTDFSTYQILDLFDSLDKDGIGFVGFEEFFLLIGLFSSRECGQSTKFLYQHSRVMFQIISGCYQCSSTTSTMDSNFTINFDKFSKLGQIIGIPEYQILGNLERFNTVIFDRINFEMFQLFYFVILDEWDRSSYPFFKSLFHDPDYIEPFIKSQSPSSSSLNSQQSQSSPKASPRSPPSQSNISNSNSIGKLSSINYTTTTNTSTTTTSTQPTPKKRLQMITNFSNQEIDGQLLEIIESLNIENSHKQYIKEQFKLYGLFNIESCRLLEPEQWAQKKDLYNNNIRIIYANDIDRNKEYPSNRISNTKYTVWNFIPKNLLEQFGRVMNIYFLFIGILQLFPSITPVDPISTWGALGFIFAISAVKEAFDDYKRGVRDKVANEREYTVLRGGMEGKKMQSQQIMVGDIVYLENDSEVPCDMVLLTTSDPEGACYVQTASLDGETDLKTRLAPQATCGYRVKDLASFRGVIECPTPNADIYRFDSRMSLRANNKVNTFSHSDWMPLSVQNIILQATHIRNTGFVYGLVVYTGNETKVGNNKMIPPTKWTRLDKLINRMTVSIFCLQLFLVLIFGAIGESLRRHQITTFWYLGYGNDYHSPWYEFIIIPLRFLLLNSMMIPISLKVTIDVIKYAYALFINWDLRMYHKATDCPATANSTALSEDLGQIEYLFTDKTGTLTENVMIFAKCSINDQIYGQDLPALEDPLLSDQLKSNNQIVIEFFRALSLCHTVVPVVIDDKLYYKASSPDEEALVKAAAEIGIKFKTKSPSMLTIELFNESNVESYQLLHSFEFSSDRKRMSVVLRNKTTQEIKIITKGADEAIFKRLSKKNNIINSIKHIEEFANLGLRTLCVSQRTIGEEDYQDWYKNHFQIANTSLEKRQEKLDETYELMERELELLGITAIEDKLQDEVPQTIYCMRQAQIKVWMLTGDKYSTALQIAHSCNLIEKNGYVFTVGKSLEDQHSQSGARPDISPVEAQVAMESMSEHIRKLDPSVLSTSTLVIEGHVLALVLNHAQPVFLSISKQVGSVICCRVTPSQKALVVKMIKDEKHITLAIGDGGNDVAMIQEANIGVGISGREGLQASRAADYSIARFRFLQDLILVHGRYSYLRSSFVANYCFYKSLFICFLQILYQLFSCFSGATFFNSFSLTSYNILFTGLPIIGYVLDKDLPENILRRNPVLYTFSQEGHSFNIFVFATWVLRALIQALLVFSFTVGAYVFSSGSTIDYNSISMISFSSIIFIQSLTLYFESQNSTSSSILSAAFNKQKNNSNSNGSGHYQTSSSLLASSQSRLLSADHVIDEEFTEERIGNSKSRIIKYVLKKKASLSSRKREEKVIELVVCDDEDSDDDDIYNNDDDEDDEAKENSPLL
eukprot:gene4923-6137_t